VTVEAPPEASLLAPPTEFLQFVESQALSQEAPTAVVYGKVLAHGADPCVTYHKGLYYLTYTRHESSQIILQTASKFEDLASSPEIIVAGHVSQPWAPKITHYPDMDVIYCAVCREKDVIETHDIEVWFRKNGELKFTHYGPLNYLGPRKFMIDLHVIEYKGEFVASYSVKRDDTQDFPQETKIGYMADPFTLDESRSVTLGYPENWKVIKAEVTEAGFLYVCEGKLEELTAQDASFSGDYKTIKRRQDNSWKPTDNPICKTDGSISGLGSGSLLIEDQCGPDLVCDIWIVTGSPKGLPKWGDRVIVAFPIFDKKSDDWGTMGIIREEAVYQV
jgi:hypothetical protein